MANSTNIINIDDDDAPVGPVNKQQAEDYAEGLN